MRQKMRGRWECQSLVLKSRCTCLFFCYYLLSFSRQSVGEGRKMGGRVGLFLFLENFLRSAWCTSFTLLRAGNSTISQWLEELFSSLVPSKCGDLYLLMPSRARKVKTAAILPCNLYNVGSCKNHMNYAWLSLRRKQKVKIEKQKCWGFFHKEQQNVV